MNITYITKELLNRMGFDDADVKEQNVEGRVKIDITLTDARDLIGERGANLAVLQYVLRRIASKQISPTTLLDIDINGYKKMREGALHDFALGVGERVRANNNTVELDPMPSFDRRVIHLALAQFSDLTTESMGEGERRYIVIRPYP